MVSPPYPPEGVRLKLDRAYEHLVAVHDEIGAFFELQPYRTVLQKVDTDGLEYVLRGYIAHPPPEMLPLIIGDCLQNMRTALDHLVWAMAIAHSGQEPPFKTSFPIYTNRDAFHDRKSSGKPTPGSGLKRIEVLPEAAQALIESFQPYHCRDEYDSHLWVLNEFSRIDRHRTLSIVVAMSHYTGVEVGRRTESGKFVSTPDIIDHATLSTGSFEHGAELYRFTLKRPEPNVTWSTTLPST